MIIHSFIKPIFRSQLDIYDKDHRQYLEQEDQLQRLQLQFEELMEDKKKKDANIAELRQRLATLQKDLDISEHVQKDFVRLSQTLQVPKYLLIKISTNKVVQNCIKNL